MKEITASGRTLLQPVSKCGGILSVFGNASGEITGTLAVETSKDGGTTFAPLTTDADGTALVIDGATTRMIYVGSGDLYVNASSASSGAKVSFEKLYNL